MSNRMQPRRRGVGPAPCRVARRRSTALLEFILIFPMFLFLIFFILDMSRVLLVSGAVQDATYRAARASATSGGASPGGRPIAKDAFQQALSEIPGGGAARRYDLVVRRGATCQAADPYVELRVSYGVDLLTPGLGALFQLSGGSGDAVPGQFDLTSTAVSRCEVVQ